MYTIKPFELLTYHDDFMFGVVMQDMEICHESLECMLGLKIDHIEYAESQKTIEPLYASHGIRLDVYVQDGSRVYDVEIQNIDEQDLGKRTRYYQSMVDMDSLLKGQDYSELKESIIIFLCRFDPFKKRIPCYTIRRLCEQDSTVNVDDAATVHIFNCTAYNKVKNENLRSFLKFVQTNKAESDFTRRLDNMVETQKQIEELKQTYLSWSLHDRDVRHEGRKEGMKEAKLEDAQNLLVMNVLTHEQIAQVVGLPLETIDELAAKLQPVAK
ncbi:MAG: Rpn family recombination-promoting nuclease/putative transposase [Spirochaetaceae bacterium]|nr:Rpn family recombination-promoting nuclease/putative transposase [Spirochaetaceae bacterium]